MHRIVFRRLLALIAAAALAGGCGGDGGSGGSTAAGSAPPAATATATGPNTVTVTPGTTPSSAAARFAAVVNGACTQARGAAPPRPPRNTDDLGAYVRSQAVAAQRVAGALSGARPPASQRERLTALRRSYGELLAAYSTALAGAPDRKAQKRIADAEAQTGRLAAAAGIPACAPSGAGSGG